MAAGFPKHKRKLPGLLKSRSGTDTMSLPLLCTGEGKIQATLIQQEWK